MTSPADKTFGRWLSVVGIGEEGFAALSDEGRRLCSESEVLFGAARHVRSLPSALQAKSRLWRTPLSLSLAELDGMRGELRVCVLATGDPLSFGIGATLVERYSSEEVRIVAWLGSFSLAAAELGWSHDSLQCHTLHGRPLETLLRCLSPSPRASPLRLLVMLGGAQSSPAKVARLLVRNGFEQTTMHLLSRLGSKNFQRLSCLASDFPLRKRFPSLSVLALSLPSHLSKSSKSSKSSLLCARQRFGMPEAAFASDGLITKREVRAVTLSSLAPSREAVLWDIGAGSGSLSIEWCLAGGRSLAVERHSGRAKNLWENCRRFGVVDRLLLYPLEAETFLALSPSPCLPDSIFLGGSVSFSLAQSLIERLVPQGRFVANAVTLAGERTLYKLQRERGGNLTRIAVQRLQPLASGVPAFLPLNPILHYVLAP